MFTKKSRIRIFSSFTFMDFNVLIGSVPAVGELPMPTNVTIHSNGSGYIMRWDPEPRTPPGTSYSVQAETDRWVFTWEPVR